ncbi:MULTISPECIES: PTS sugar transporter subunit IIA [Thermoactinomyces]|jgi:mannitol PTS system EIIA component|uniref:Mannitol-specific phosphotransferase enzyme IIA component n=1 Tax=Thermoactinomyces vulgaris TaxID=2026 RepID=A0ABS0QII8_THEVU|nr:MULTISPECIES: PTS sugar transporter subunit IIA [Thermoactinomyces]KFZ40556.1 PTS mannitol transporter subunit IIA [Thermoactinomyces sp. Gus2-1]KYQ87265.1 PTS mannitol transporter subunit IIA [Thermoactinomyces sp. AS95]MBA4552063.1 PTS sugar transporter subunit IIA [Thermoactinomyces vulgaris]MBA4597447.1 PTS sugar transporter subunit IIA [Thermoactinomyces vulgaris]MBH8586716.1 PTS sugar transporter subunit IIA [Thermoactinomyces sp. CICC 10520]
MASSILSPENIRFNASVDSKEEAIRLTGQLLVERGYVKPAYVDTMLEREKLTSTYMGNYVAIPHGTEEGKENVIESGIVIVQVPDGVDFGDGNIVKLLIGIAAKGDEHLEILSKIALVVAEEENVHQIVQAETAEEIMKFF